MKKRLEALGRMKAPIPKLCYAVCILGWLAVCLYQFTADSLTRAGGGLDPMQMQPEQFTLAGLQQQEDGTWLTLDGDPQMIWYNEEGRAVRTLLVDADYSTEPRETCLYYTTREGEDFSQDKRVFPEKQPDGSSRYTLPYGAITALRLDPCSPDPGKPVVIGFEAITMNEPAGALSYFVPSWYEVFCLILYPGMLAAAVSLARQAWLKTKTMRKNKQ
ncbi:MAG: hypothetical protein IJ484_08405 [Oscillospiraceae bacterium]|nr:hypothetical protein [Oscillospiraceae bacterium]